VQRVFVLDQEKRPLMPCRPARARWLLTQQRAAVFRSQPFVIILREARPEAAITPLRLKIDPGSLTTGLAVLQQTSSEVMWGVHSALQGAAAAGWLSLRSRESRASSPG
jgi:hypothetical protein